MDLKFLVPGNPDNPGFYWLNFYDKKADAIKTKIPYVEYHVADIIRKIPKYATLDFKFHKFFKYHNIDYTMIYTPIIAGQYWHIHMKDKHALMFKLCWIDAKDVYYNY